MVGQLTVIGWAFQGDPCGSYLATPTTQRPSNGKKSLPIPAVSGNDNGILLCGTQPGPQWEGDFCSHGQANGSLMV